LSLRSAALPHRLTIALLGAALAIGLLQGCGSGSGDTAHIESKAGIVKRANAICEANGSQLLSEVNDLLASPRANINRKGAATTISEILAREMQIEADEFRTFDVPPEDEEQFGAIIEAMQRVATEAKTNPESFLGPPPASLTEAQKLARGYGITACPVV